MTCSEDQNSWHKCMMRKRIEDSHFKNWEINKNIKKTAIEICSIILDRTLLIVSSNQGRMYLLLIKTSIQITWWTEEQSMMPKFYLIEPNCFVKIRMHISILKIWASMQSIGVRAIGTMIILILRNFIVQELIKSMIWEKPLKMLLLHWRSKKPRLLLNFKKHKQIDWKCKSMFKTLKQSMIRNIHTSNEQFASTKIKKN